MIKKKQIQAGQDPIKNALKGIDLLQLVFFYRQLSKLKSNRESYHIEFVLKSCYSELALFEMEEIEKFVAEFISQSASKTSEL
ncbi:hypothetical protein N9Q55_04145 [Flavobacteriaceae bacterium]|nr:hypothetical protein [Flavobacteriaceae bacterium]MDA9928571.1 hypothetical protein [Flavobacteriaceae bacterium]MDC6456686.1 hypothetical protein [Flavobacteriaceae bacterium]